MDMSYFNSDARKGVLLVMLAALVSGFSIFVNSIGVKEFDSSIFTFLKNLAVAVLLFSVILMARQVAEIKKLRRKQWLQLALIGLVGGSIPFLIFFRGLQMAAGAASGFIHKTMFIYVAVFAVIFLREKLTKGLLIGAFLLLIGNYFLIKPEFNLSFGHLLVFAATLFWAAENTYAKHVLKEVSGNVVAFGRMFFGSLFILAFLVFAGKISLVGSLTITHFMWIGLTSAFLLLYVLSYYNGLKHIKVTTAASILLLGQPITAVLSFLFSGKAVSLSNGFGMLLIVMGIVSVLWLSGILAWAGSILGVKAYGRA